MARFTFIDNGTPFDGRTPALFPLGGAELAVVSLAETLAARGHRVTVLNRCPTPVEHNGVSWRPFDMGAPASGLYVLNRDPRLLEAVPHKRRAALWLHNDARYLRKWRYALPLLRHRPATIFLSAYHASTWPFPRNWLAKHIIPLGVDAAFSHAAEWRTVPPPRAVFASNPERGLLPLLKLWLERIHPRAPDAELHLYTCAAFYGAQTNAARRAAPVIDWASTLRAHNVLLHEMVPRISLAELYPSMRTMLYWGDAAHAETFCLSIAEAQASALPCVARPMGALPERFDHGRTGFLEHDSDKFADAAVSLLTNEETWRRCRQNARAADRPSWAHAADCFEALHG